MIPSGSTFGYTSLEVPGHVAVTLPTGAWFISGCECGWIGRRRSVLQTAIADRLLHVEQAGLP